jgi:basic amino acid/polyamine antiporter, APA family
VTAQPSLHRRLGLSDAVAIGLGSMLGAGIFAALAPAARAAGGALIVGLVIAGVIAWCNATSSAQLAAQFPESGGTYIYGRRLLGEWPGFVAGWSFVVGKTASCAAMALTVAAYVAPEGWQKPVAVLAVLGITGVASVGVQRTATATKVIVAIVLAVLVLVVVAGAVAGAGPGIDELVPAGTSLYGVLQAAGLLFFAFAGYARIATLGEEVREPGRTIPRAITIALSLALAVYLVVAVTALAVLGPDALAASRAPLADVAAAGGWDWTAPFVRAGAALAALGALLALATGVTRTMLAMARERDLPTSLARVHEGAGVPRTAALALGAVVIALVLITDLRTAIGFSSFGVLLYYLIANASALRQSAEHRRYPRAFAALGAAGCLILAATLPAHAIAIAAAVIAVGIGYRVLKLRGQRPDAEPR